jgi:hypothetical protein
LPQISCEWRDHANHEHENPASIDVSSGKTVRKDWT